MRELPYFPQEAHEAGCDCSVKPEMTDTCDIRIESQGASSTFIVCADQGYTFDLLLNNSAGESSLVLISFSKAIVTVFVSHCTLIICSHI